MTQISYEEFEKAVETLGLLKLTTAEEIRKKYLKLSKKYHPDMQKGDSEKFQEINRAYKILSKYIENFRFQFTKEEFSDQFPLSGNFDSDWISKKKQ